MRRWIPLWVVPVVIIMAVGTVWLRLTIVRTTYAINQAEKKARALRQERERVELKLTGLRSPRRLEQLAHSRFSLNRPHADQVVHMK